MELHGSLHAVGPLLCGPSREVFFFDSSCHGLSERGARTPLRQIAHDFYLLDGHTPFLSANSGCSTDITPRNRGLSKLSRRIRPQEEELRQIRSACAVAEEDLLAVKIQEVPLIHVE